MFKNILVSFLCVFIVSATSNPDEFGEFLNGFNDQLQIEDDPDFDKCADVPLITDVNKTFHDLNSSIPNPFALVEDVMALYNDYNNIKANCPEVIKVYEQFFSNFTTALRNDTSDTLLSVLETSLMNLNAIEAALIDGHNDLDSGNYYGAGEDLGKVVSLSLQNYIK